MDKASTELVESLHQFITIWRLIGKPFPQVDATDRPGLAISWPNTRFPFYNSLFLTEQLTDARVLQDRVQEAAAYMRTRPYGGLFVVCLDNLSRSAKENLAAILARAKFVQAIPMTGVAGDILPMEAPGHPVLRFVRISDESTIQALGELNCVAYGVPIETSRSLVKEPTLWHQLAYGFVAYEGDKPVSTATAIINQGCVFLFLVATAPDARSKGYREAVTRHALQRAHEATGLWRTVLHATELGYPVYLRLGYHPTVKFMGCMLESWDSNGMVAVSSYKGSPAALVAYETPTEKISLLIASSKSAVIAGGEEVHSGALTFHYRNGAKSQVITWTNHGITYALVSSLTGSPQHSCLVCHQDTADQNHFNH